MRGLFTLLIVTFFLTDLIDGGPSCMDENGNPVDGWVALKQANNFNLFVQTGSKFVKSKYMLNQTSKAV